MPFFNFTCKSEDTSSLIADISSRKYELLNPSSSRTQVEGEGKTPLASIPKKGTDSPLATFELNYRNLPDYLRCCLDYICVYGERGYSMEKRKLVWLLLAKGLIQPKPGDIMEDSAEKIIEELASFGMLQDVDDRSCVKVAAPYWGFFKVEKQTFVNAVSENSPVHLVVHGGGDKDIPTNFHDIFVQSLFFMATGHSFPTRTFLSGANLGAMFSGLKFLLVLDMDREIEYLPNEVGDLVHLRYLSLENSDISELPASIGNLKKLQTLNLRMCGDLKKLPNEVLNMQQLRHIEMSSCNADGEIRVPSGIGMLTNLHTFCGLYAGDGIAQELSSLTQLRELGVKRVYDDHADELLRSVMKMVDLVSLSLEAETTWVNEDDDSRKTTFLPSLEGFLPPPLLHELHLVGRLVEFPEWIASMGNLTRLNLSFSYLSDSPTPVLQFLPKLKHLNLWHACNFSYIGKEFCPAGGFQQLETFTLACDSLVGWTEIENGAFPSLKYLCFDCPKLKLLPEGLQNLSELQKLGIYPLHHDLQRRLNGREKYKIEHIVTLSYCHPFPNPWSDE